MASRLGRQDSNLGSWIQSPLPYRLATAEEWAAPTALAAREHLAVYHTARHLPPQRGNRFHAAPASGRKRAWRVNSRLWAATQLLSATGDVRRLLHAQA